MDEDQMYDFPKADLHRHIDGSMKPELMLKIAKQYEIKLPTFSPEEFKKLYDIGGLPVEELFKRFSWAIAAMRHPDALKEAVYNQVLDLAEENILYAELRFAPGYHSKYPSPFYKSEEYEAEVFPSMSLDEVMNNTIAGIEKGMKETGIQVNLTVCIPRETISMYGEESAYEIARLAVKYRNKGVTALDLACDEFTYPPLPYARIFQWAKGQGLYNDPHAGEMGKEDYRLNNIRVCVQHLMADGIGHALPLWKDYVLVDCMRGAGVRVERNPWASELLRGNGDDGTEFLLKNNVLISICSDDPALMGQSLTDNFVKVIDEYGWSDSDIHKITANAVNSGFYRNPEQKKLVESMFRKHGLRL